MKNLFNLVALVLNVGVDVNVAMAMAAANRLVSGKDVIKDVLVETTNALHSSDLGLAIRRIRTYNDDAREAILPLLKPVLAELKPHVTDLRKAWKGLLKGRIGLSPVEEQEEVVQ